MIGMVALRDITGAKEVQAMSNRCFICNKGLMKGNNVSHSNIKTKRELVPNLQRVKILVDGKVVRRRVCTRCIRSGKIAKA